MSEVIVVTSGKGGVGKTTTSANVGTGLAMLGEKVILIDTDIGLRNLDVVMGLENRIVYNLVDVVEGNCRLKQALIKDKRYPNLFLLPSAQTRDKSSVTPGQMRKLVDDLREECDYVLLDCPAGIEQGFKNAIAGADRAFVVTTPEVSAIRDADRIIGLLEAEEIQEMSMGKSVIYILLGAVAIAVGSDWVVDGACTVAAAIGISQTLIGLTVVAFGTSLPELVTSIVAAKKGEVDMALGNVIGSNIFNILMVLGIAAAISPVAFLIENIIDIAVLIVFSVIGWIMAWTKRELNRKEGIIMLLLYAVYVVYICMR